jgi:hypothetical protein
MSQVYAVLAGELVGRGMVEQSAVDHSMSILAETVAQAPWAGPIDLTETGERRWQVILQNPQYALRLSAVIMAALTADSDALSTRIAVAAGQVDLREGQPTEAQGSAIRRAWHALRGMKRGRALVAAPDGLPMSAQATAPLLDALCQQWTEAQAAPIALKLHPDAPAQIKLAQSFGITAQSLNRRLQLARWREIETALRVVEATPLQDGEDRRIAV